MTRFTGILTTLTLLAIIAAPAFAQGVATQANGQQDPAQQLEKASEELATALKELEAKPDDAAFIEAAVNAYLGKVMAANRARNREAFDSAYAGMTELTTRVIESNMDNGAIVNAYLQCQQYQLQSMTGSVDEKVAAYDAFESKLDSFTSEDDAVKGAVMGARRMVASLKSRITAEKAREELIGSDAPALPADTTWVNGTPLTAEDLEGKVVFLDFWAVWCGPCIATFPHLREWNEKYADKGLVMIGATRYYSYGWDETAQRPARVDGISQDDERAAMQKFAEHHNLDHRFAVVSDASFAASFGVTGIPQAVVIDREGKVRMIKVGSGEANAKDLDALLEELLSETSSGDDDE